MTPFNANDKKSRIFLVAVIIATMLAAFLLVSVMASLSTSVFVEFSVQGIDNETTANILIVDDKEYEASKLPIILNWETGSTHSFSWISPILSNSNKLYGWTSTNGLSFRQSDTVTASFFDGRIKAIYTIAIGETSDDSTNGTGNGIDTGGPKLSLFNPEINESNVTIDGVALPGTPDTFITKIQWDWGDGTTENRGFPASHTYKENGTYTVTVTCYQNDNKTAKKSVTVSSGGQLESEIPTEGCCGSNSLLFEVIGKAETDYLRTVVGAVYEGSKWTNDPNCEIVPYDGGHIPLDISTYTRKIQSIISVDVAISWNGFVPVVYRTNRLDFSENLQTDYYPQQQIFKTKSSFQDPYSITFTRYEFDESLLRTSNHTTENPSSTYLQIPEKLRTRLQGLLDKIGIQNLPTSYDRIIAIKNYLQSNYDYDVNYNRAPAGIDPVEWFLFEEKRGVCANFNSAFVLLLRTSGIPARVVAGYKISGNVEYQEVKGKQAHAWAEINFENLGWVEFDATRPGSGCCCSSESSSASQPSPSPPPSSSKTQTVTEITELSSSALKGGTFSVKGSVTDEKKNPLSGLKVVISLKKNKAELSGLVCSQTGASSGLFSVTCNVPPTISVGNYQVVATTIGNEAYYGSESDPVLTINAETEIAANSPELISTKQTFLVIGQLTEKEAATPIQGVQLSLDYTVEGQKKTLTSTTNQTGHAKFSCEPIMNYIETGINYTISFKGVDYYLPSEIHGQIKIQQPSNEETPIQEENQNQAGSQTYDTSPLLLASIPSSALAITGVFLFLRKRKKDTPKSKPEIIIQEAPPTGKTVVNAGLDTIELAIVFPQIAQPFPDVWGVNEALTVEFHLKKNNNPFEGAVGLTVDEALPKDLVTNNLGIASLELQIKEKGTHTLTAEYKGNLTSGSCSAKRNIKIVDYTEEVVNIFNETFAFEKDKGAVIGEETTPREFQKAVISTFKLVDKQSLDHLVSLFEIANYSLYILRRKEYETMFLASLSVKNSPDNSKNSG
jgi:PKD repeat protein